MHPNHQLNTGYGSTVSDNFSNGLSNNHQESISDNHQQGLSDMGSTAAIASTGVLGTVLFVASLIPTVAGFVYLKDRWGKKKRK